MRKTLSKKPAKKERAPAAQPQSTAAKPATVADAMAEFAITMPPKATRRGPSPLPARRKALRDAAFGEIPNEQYWHKSEAAFCTTPRALPLLATLIRRLAKGADAARVYVDLWSRQHEDGFVIVHDEEAFAIACDYAEGSGVRYWREAMAELQRLGFIKVAPMNRRKYGFIHLVHHDSVVRQIYADPTNMAPTWWLPMYERALIDYGAKRRRKPTAAASS